MININKNSMFNSPAIIVPTLIVILGLTFFLPTNLTAKDGPQSMLELRKIALLFIQKQSRPNAEKRIQFARWDKRIKLHKCDSSKIQAFYPGKQQHLGNISIGLRCQEKPSWTIYLRAHISAQQKIVHAKHFITRGTVITKNDLIIEKIEVSNSNRHFYHSKKDIIGKVAKRNIRMGIKISAMALKPALVIKRGQEVMIVAKAAGLIIRTKGKALSDGAIGQIVRVKNTRSKRILQARVVAPNTVEVNM
ncbi:MAG: flagellar basal body P-ring formation chaperone FlgA [Gammaproteobacteria bacterium]